MWRSLFLQLGLSWLHFGNCNQLVLLPLRRAGNGVNVELSGRLSALQLFALRPVAVSAPVYPAAAHHVQGLGLSHRLQSACKAISRGSSTSNPLSNDTTHSQLIFFCLINLAFRSQFHVANTLQCQAPFSCSLSHQCSFPYFTSFLPSYRAHQRCDFLIAERRSTHVKTCFRDAFR